MSRYFGNQTQAPLLEIAARWRDRCLIDQGSILSEEKIWTNENVAALQEHFVNNLDAGEGTFFEKLEAQLSNVSPSAKILAAEMLWVLLLCPSNITARKKTQSVREVYEWSGKSIDADLPALQPDLLAGVGSAGPGFNQFRWAELVFLIQLTNGILDLSREDRMATLTSTKLFEQWLEGIPDQERRQFRHMILFLLFPDSHERIFGASDRVKCAIAFSEHSRKEISAMTPQQIDKVLASTRERLTEEYGTSDLDWYVPPLRAYWQPTSKNGTELATGEITQLVNRFLEQSKTGDLKTKDYPKNYEGLEIRVSFGAGNQARVTWICLLAPGQTPSQGISPVFLYYKQQNLLVLAKSISETNAPKIMWPHSDEETVKQYMQKHYEVDPFRYGTSLVYGAYDLAQGLDEERMLDDLLELIDEYKVLAMPDQIKEEPDNPYETDTLDTNEELTAQVNADELFIDEAETQRIIDLLLRKKNVVLQGPPGTGKTFVARQIADMLIGNTDSHQIDLVQFHQSYSYEDFVQGYRPGESGFTLINGKFFSFCKRAAASPEKPFVFLIDEINRGNLSKILGELMMLIESDKRSARWATRLAYAGEDDEPFFVPKNVYILGMMNTADRSLAMVDYALRRRFSFIDVSPAIESSRFHNFLLENGAAQAIIDRIVDRIGTLNRRISEDRTNLGPGFCIGHSFFCKPSKTAQWDEEWFESVIRTEIEPLIREYWFDDPELANQLVEDLLA